MLSLPLEVHQLEVRVELKDEGYLIRYDVKARVLSFLHKRWKQIFVEKQVIVEFLLEFFFCHKGMKNDDIMNIFQTFLFYFVLICKMLKSGTFGYRQ